ncbi:MAG: transglutaminase-like cysteine peptidase [Candidatus Bathyarchaeota archaeon]|nr:transglutaminase-like cysteine peptidase [Candidatus Bathyarchaeota archaeon]
MRGLVIFLIVVVVLVVCIAPFTLWGQIQNFLSQANERLTPKDSQQETAKPRLAVNVEENSSYWDITAEDLRVLVSELAFSVSNLGNASAKNVKINTIIDGKTVSTESVALLQPSEVYTSSVTVNVVYNSAMMVTVDATCSASSASKTVIVNANLTRFFDENLCRSFITPQDPNVIALKNKILQDKLPVAPDWMAMRDWVGNNIKYKTDSEIHGVAEFWQFPNETLQLKTGDCEDFSILLCSLLRADGWAPDKAYVIVGEQNNQYHAWVRVIWNDIKYNIEPQGNGFAIALGDVLSLSGYTAKYYFNDVNFGAFQ